MKNRSYKIIAVFIVVIIVISMVGACQKAQEAKPTPVFEFQQFNPTKAPVQPTAIKDNVEEKVEITVTVKP
jgi:negative regulator of sigma E activity